MGGKDAEERDEGVAFEPASKASSAASPPQAGRRSVVALLRHFVLHPLRLIVGNTSILFVFFVVIAFNFITQKGDAQPITQMGKWAFEALPALIVSVSQSAVTIAGILVLFIVKTVLGVVVAQEMMLVYQRKRRGIWDSLRRVTFSNILWFVGAEVVTYGVFGVVAFLFYMPAYWVWHSYRVDFTIPLLVLFALLYPAFYICLSTTSMVAVMPLRSRKRIQKLRYLLTARGAIKMWLFYTVRLSIEGFLLFVVPFFAVSVLKNYFLASVSAAFGLMVPFALLRGSSYELKLDLFSGDPDVESMFALHYRSLRGREDTRNL